MCQVSTERYTCSTCSTLNDKRQQTDSIPTQQDVMYLPQVFQSRKEETWDEKGVEGGGGGGGRWSSLYLSG